MWIACQRSASRFQNSLLAFHVSHADARARVTPWRAAAHRCAAARGGMGSAPAPRMTHARQSADDAAFLAALDQFDGGAGPGPTLSRALPPLDARPFPPAEPMPAGDRGWIALGVVGFLLMMGLGAASAALVFQDRVALLLR